MSLFRIDAPWTRWGRPALPVVVVSALLCLGIANVATLATWHEVEDGVLWRLAPDGVSAEAIAPGSPASAVNLQPGDLLVAIDDQPVQALDDVARALDELPAGGSARYTVLRLGSREVVDVRVSPVVSTAGTLYFLLAAVGIFTLLVGGAVRLRRPHDQATLHFFWLSVAFFGLFTFSFSGPLTRLEWAFFWGDEIASLLLPPLFLHFALVFPERRETLVSSRAAQVLLPLLYAPAGVLALALALTVRSPDIEQFVALVGMIERVELLYLVFCFLLGAVALARALSEVRSLTARRQLRWIAWGTMLGAAPFVLGYAVPYAVGVDPSLPMQLSAVPLSFIPLAFASAIVRYRLRDIEVIVKRAAVYAVALAAIVVLAAVVLQALDRVLVPGDGGDSWLVPILVAIVAVLLAPPVKAWIQHALDRAFYRDRYNFRRALGGFARDLNSDLDLNRLADRLVSRVVETLLVDRMALMLGDEDTVHYASVRASGFGDGHPPALPRRSGIGLRVGAGHSVVLDDPMAVSRFAVEEIEFWRDAGLYYFIPCVTNEGTIAVLALGRRSAGEPLSSEDMGLLETVTGQMATALENARLYRQLHLKALDLERTRAFSDNILESLSSGLLVVDADDRVVRWNSALEQIYGVTRREALDQPLDALFDVPFVGTLRAARRDSPEGASLARMRLAGRGATVGRTLIVNVAVVPLRATDVAGTAPAGTIIILEDITARVQLEEQLQISEKMASIGLLAAGVAHEVNTPLTGISSYTQMLLENADPEDPRTPLLQKIERQTFRAAKIVNGLLNLSRPAGAASPDRVLLDVNAMITDVLSLLEHQLAAHRIKVRRELSAEPLIVSGIEHKLQQVLLNLCLNAKDAMPKGGWLSIATRAEDGRVIIEVSDTGSGIPPEYLARIYDPFFTTKTMGQGTGLGLSITYGIVREHDGTIDCDSSVGQGTRFVIGLPAARTAARASRAARQ